MKTGGLLLAGVLGVIAIKSGLFSGLFGNIGNFISGGGVSGDNDVNATPTNGNSSGGDTVSGQIGYNDVAAVTDYLNTHGQYAPSGFVKSNSSQQLTPQALQLYAPLQTVGVLGGASTLFANQGLLSQQSAVNIANYNAVKQNPSLAWAYAGGNFMEGVSQEGISQASWAFETSGETINRRALSYWAQQTGAHRGAMDSAERKAWDAANLSQARSAYLAASGQATRSQSPYVVH